MITAQGHFAQQKRLPHPQGSRHPPLENFTADRIALKNKLIAVAALADNQKRDGLAETAFGH
ncbi:MAG: hypothetical protein ACKO81_02215 [Planctomycetota bacterium]